MEENKQQADGPYGSNQLFIFKAFIIFILGSLSLYIYIYIGFPKSNMKDKGKQMKAL